MTHGNVWLDAREAHAVLARAGLDALGNGEVLCATAENYSIWFPETEVVVQVHGIRSLTVSNLRGPFERRGFTRSNPNNPVPSGAGQGSAGQSGPLPPHSFQKGAPSQVVVVPPETPPTAQNGGPLIPRYLLSFPALCLASGPGTGGSDHSDREGAASPHYTQLDEGKRNDAA